MPTLDLTPRLARESKSNGKDNSLFNKAVTGFGFRIHPSDRKVWIVQARIECCSRHIVIARHDQTRLRATARDYVPGRDMGIASARLKPLSWYRQEPEEQRCPIPRR